MNYPGRIIRQNDTDITAVKFIQQQLNLKGCGPLKVDGDFGLNTLHAIMLFQTCFTDLKGRSLKADGTIGPMTWGALFDSESLPVITEAPNQLLGTVLDVARSQIGVSEKPTGSNNGQEINKYQDAVGIEHGKWWDMAFIYWCFNEAGKNLNRENPLFKTGQVIEEWCNSPGKRITAADAKVNVSLVLPGQIFIISTGGGFGHAGIVEKNESGILTTIEGNTCVLRNGDGNGVFRRTDRTVDMINVGFLEFN